MLQNLSELKIGWDEAVPEEVRSDLLKFVSQLSSLSSVKIPKSTGTFKTSSWDFHYFCDAFEGAFATSWYVVTKIENKIEIKLFTEKAKVAPINVISVPRHELCVFRLLGKIFT